MEAQYLELVRILLAQDSNKVGRNGPTSEVIGHVLRCDLAEGFPAVTTKRLFWKGVKAELEYFLKGETDTKVLEAQGVNIWRANTEATNGDMGPMYGHIWRHATAIAPPKPTRLTEEERIKSAWEPDAVELECIKKRHRKVDQLARVLDQLANEPTSRRILMTSFSPALADEGVLWPCHGISIQFFVIPFSSADKNGGKLEDENGGKLEDKNGGRLSCMMHQRSADVFLGLPFNIASYALLTHAVAECVGLEVGELIITIGSAHLYDVHREAAALQLTREPKPMATYDGAKDPRYITVGERQLRLGGLQGYSSHPTISAPMVV